MTEAKINNKVKLVRISLEIGEKLENAIATLKVEHGEKVTEKDFTEQAIEERIKKLKLNLN